MFALDKCVKKDIKKAFEWYEKAASQGLAEAQNNLGSMYYYGEGVEKDSKKAFVWYEKAASQGFADAQYNLGNMYYYGEGTTMNNTQYTTLLAEILEKVTDLMAAKNPNASQVLDQAAKFVATVNRQHRKLVREAKAALKTATTTDKAK